MTSKENAGDTPPGGFLNACREHAPILGSRCGMGLLLENLTWEQRDEVWDALQADPLEVTSRAIERALHAYGWTRPDGRVPKADAIARHRRGACNCPKETT